MLLTLKKAIQICEDARHVPIDEYLNVEPKETYPGALGHAQAVLMGIQQDLEIFTSDTDIM